MVSVCHSAWFNCPDWALPNFERICSRPTPLLNLTSKVLDTAISLQQPKPPTIPC